jgi:hypothetical protein
MYRAVGTFYGSNLTAAAGTPITFMAPPSREGYTLLTAFIYKAAGTEHTVTVMRSLEATTLSASEAAAATVIDVTAAPGTGTPAGLIAANDWVVIQLDDGNFFLVKVSSVSANAITIATALPSAAAASNAFWFFGAPGDHVSSQTTLKTNHAVGSQYKTGTSQTITRADYAAGLLRSHAKHQPVVLYSDNATAAGQFEQITGAYVA